MAHSLKPADAALNTRYEDWDAGRIGARPISDRDAVATMLADRDIRVIDLRGWQRIDEFELLDRRAAPGVAVVSDTIVGFQGPLAGMLSGLRAATTEWMLCVSCDALHLLADLALRLHATAAPRRLPLPMAMRCAPVVCCTAVSPTPTELVQARP